MLKQKIRIRVPWSSWRAWRSGNSADLPERGGVYELLVKQTDGTWLRRYVGKGASIKERFGAHLLPSESNACLRRHLSGKLTVQFRYALIPSPADRADAEQALWDRYQHNCNQVRPAGSGRGFDVEIVEE